MPYIAKDRRSIAEGSNHQPGVREFGSYAKTPGELNFLITQLIIGYHSTRKLSYQTINDVIGALEGAKQEYYRRVAAPYEQSKIRQNGDVY